MPDAAFDDHLLASLYDRVNGPWAPCDDFYLDLIRATDDVLDVGCGTGLILHRARADGHRGRLVGLDPAAGMLTQARTRTDVEWVQGTLPSADYTAEFDLVTMTGHAFQVLQTDADVAAFLSAARAALRPGGRLAFETRNPLRRPWQHWTPDRIETVADDDGHEVRLWHDLIAVDGEHVTFTESFECPAWTPPLRVSRSTLRFVPVGRLDELLAETGFAIDDRYGEWDGSPFTDDSREIITVASARP